MRVGAWDVGRCIACVNVFFLHWNVAEATAFVGMGHEGVQFFFALSGFIITRGLLREQRVSLRNFYVKRFARIYPSYFALLLYSVFVHNAFRELQPAVADAGWNHSLTLFRRENVWRTFLYNSFFIPIDNMQGHVWTIIVEEQFYVLIPLVVKFAPSMWVRRLLFVLVIAVFVVLRALLGHVSLVFHAYDTLAMGCLFATFSLEERFGTRALCASLVAFLVIPTSPWQSISTFVFPMVDFWKQPRVLYAILPVLKSIAAATVVVSSMKTPTHSFLAPVERLGKRSYAFYIWHEHAMAPFAALRGTDVRDQRLLPAAFYSCVAAAYILGDIADTVEASIRKRFLAPADETRSRDAFAEEKVDVDAQETVVVDVQEKVEVVTR